VHLLLGLIGAVVGGAIGAAVWALVSNLTGYEIGFVAWGVGVAAGVGMVVASGGRAGAIGGVLAALVALTAVAIGKYAVVAIAINSAMTGSGGEELAISYIADDHVVRFKEEGRPLDWPEGFDETTMLASRRAHYPVDVWRLAESDWMATPAPLRELALTYGGAGVPATRDSMLASLVVERWAADGREVQWPEGVDPDLAYGVAEYPPDAWLAAQEWGGSMTPEEQAAVLRVEFEKYTEAYSDEIRAMQGDLFVSRFGLFDLLWAFLAAGTAFKIGAASTEE